MWGVTPPKSGGDNSVLGLALSIAKHANCTLATVDEHIEQIIERPSIEGLRILNLPASDHRKNKISRLKIPKILYGNTPPKRSLRYAHSKILQDTLAKITKNYDAVVLNHPWMWPALKKAMQHNAPPIIYDAHNVESLILKKSNNSKLINFFSSASARNIEKDICKHASQIWCCTEDDATSFIADFGATIRSKTLIGFKGRHPSSAEIKKFSERGPTAVFVGSNWGPNNLASTFINEILAPQLKEIEFHIIGSVGSTIKKPAKNIVIRGYIDDLDAELSNHRVALNPTTSGSGINIKMLDYMATGTPIVTTAFGARGIQGVSGIFSKTSELSDFGSEVNKLIHDESYWECRSLDARQSFSEKFTWDQIGQQAAVCLQKAAKSR